jgi:uncharacterized glyoxalase superfamily protein PhnB
MSSHSPVAITWNASAPGRPGCPAGPVDVLGFAEVVASPNEHGGIGHAKLRWSGGGALVCGSTRYAEVDSVHRRVVDAGGEVVEPPQETRFGSGPAAYVCTVRDPEGNSWAFAPIAAPPNGR